MHNSYGKLAFCPDVPTLVMWTGFLRSAVVLFFGLHVAFHDCLSMSSELKTR